MRIYPIILCILLSFGLSAQERTDKQIKELTKKPENLKAEIIDKDGKQFIHLTWGDEPHDDIEELEYIIFTNGFSNEMAYLASINIRKNSYDHSAPNRFGQLYKFQVQTEYEKGYSFEQSPRSDTLEIYVPSKTLPVINMQSSSVKGNQVTLNWKYSDRIDDLVGFRLYSDGELFVSEKLIPASSRTYTTKPLIPGKYKFQLKGVTRYDVESELSSSRTHTIEE